MIIKKTITKYKEKPKMKINVVIPLAGAGKRFYDAGYKEYKPFIKVIDDTSMINLVISNISSDCFHYIFIINKDQITEKEFRKHIKCQDENYEVISTDMTNGPAESVLKAESSIDNENPLIVINCDQMILDFKDHFLYAFASANNADGVIGCFISSSKKNSYIKVDPNGEVTEVKEKIVISNLATNGLHFWKKGSYFVESAKEMIKCNDRYNDEFYIAPTYNYMIKKGLKVLPYFFNLHFPMGTPEDLVSLQNMYNESI